MKRVTLIRAASLLSFVAALIFIMNHSQSIGILFLVIGLILEGLDSVGLKEAFQKNRLEGVE